MSKHFSNGNHTAAGSDVPSCEEEGPVDRHGLRRGRHAPGHHHRARGRGCHRAFLAERSHREGHDVDLNLWGLGCSLGVPHVNLKKKNGDPQEKPLLVGIYVG